MNILLTNDDGIDSGGLQKLALALRCRGHRVFVIAPDVNRSGISHALSLFGGPVKLTAQGEDTWSCSGYPVDCVVVALKGALPLKPDLVISGINCGANLGTDIIYSGTAAAARQASLNGVPAIALSLVGNSPFNWDMAATWSVDHLEELLSFWRGMSFVNVNIPNNPDFPRGMAVAWPAAKRYNDSLSIMEAPDGKRWCFLDADEDNEIPEAGSDCDIICRNLVSVSPVYNYPAVLRDLCPSPSDNFVKVTGRAGGE